MSDGNPNGAFLAPLDVVETLFTENRFAKRCLRTARLLFLVAYSIIRFRTPESDSWELGGILIWSTHTRAGQLEQKTLSE